MGGGEFHVGAFVTVLKIPAVSICSIHFTVLFSSANPREFTALYLLCTHTHTYIQSGTG